MCSYNAVNGVPTCADDYLLQTVLRGYWGWGEGDVSRYANFSVASLSLRSWSFRDVFQEPRFDLSPIRRSQDMTLGLKPKLLASSLH